MEFIAFIVLLLSFQNARTDQIHGFNDSSQILDKLNHSFEYWHRIMTNIDMSAFPGRNALLNFISLVKPSSLRDDAKVIVVINASSDLLQSKCSEDIEYLLKNLKSSWAIEMLDANAKLPSGMLLGNFLWTGSYRECIESYAPVGNTSKFGDFHGQYCNAMWTIALPKKVKLRELPLRTGICVPDSCSTVENKDNILSILKLLERAPFLKHLGDNLHLESLDCNLSVQKPDDSALWFLAILGAFLFIVILASVITIIERIQIIRSKLYQRLKSITNGSVNIVERNLTNRSLIAGEDQIPVLIPYELEDDQRYMTRVTGPWPEESCWTKMCTIPAIKKCIKCFCLFTNGAKILDTDNTSANLSCIHGIRFISMTWVILGHTYEHGIYTTENSVDVLKDADNWPFQVLMQATFSVDSFFLLSGFLLAYLYLNEADKRRGKINWFSMCLHRYVRLTPVYAVLIGFNTLVFQYTGSGPFWHEVTDKQYCEKYWWWNLLYINNFVPLKSMCVAWTWYLANEMQFFVLCSSLLYILWRWPKFGLSIYSSMLLSSWIVTWTLSEYYSLPPFFYGMTTMKNYTKFQDEIYDSWDLTYSKPYCRIGPYIIGILLAYLLYKTGRKPFLNWWIQVSGWAAACFCCLSVIYGLYHVPYMQELFNIYNAFSRSGFALGLSWVIFACLTGYGGPVNWLLSRKIWIPLSRITYCAYLFHPLLMTWYFQTRKVPLYFTHETMVFYFFAFLFVSYGAGFLISLMFETPVINLEKHLSKS